MHVAAHLTDCGTSGQPLHLNSIFGASSKLVSVLSTHEYFLRGSVGGAVAPPTPSLAT